MGEGTVPGCLAGGAPGGGAGGSRRRQERGRNGAWRSKCRHARSCSARYAQPELAALDFDFGQTRFMED